MGGLLGGSLQRRHCIVSVCSGSLVEIGFLYAGWYILKTCLATGWMRWMDRMGRGWDGDGVERPTLAGAEGEPTFFLEVRWATGSGGRRREAVADTNCVGAARALIICVRAAE